MTLLSFFGTKTGIIVLIGLLSTGIFLYQRYSNLVLQNDIKVLEFENARLERNNLAIKNQNEGLQKEISFRQEQNRLIIEQIESLRLSDEESQQRLSEFRKSLTSAKEREEQLKRRVEEPEEWLDLINMQLECEATYYSVPGQCVDGVFYKEVEEP